jgi:glutathione S-transferase
LTTPVIYLFAISHYCEKALFAFDHFRIVHHSVPLAPGPHIKFCRSLGVDGSSLPVLVDGEFVLQGSAQIVDWAQARNTVPELALETADDTPACREIEQRLDRVFGVHVRRYFYSEALLQQPQLVRPIFCKGLPWTEQLIVRVAWGKICQAMIRGLDLGPEQGLESRQIIETELAWLDDILADGRQFLVGKRFSRADLAAASLLSTIALPPQHPTYRNLKIPPGIAADLALWQQRPSLRWAREIYRRYRNPAQDLQSSNAKATE